MMRYHVGLGVGHVYTPGQPYGNTGGSSRVDEDMDAHVQASGDSVLGGDDGADARGQFSRGASDVAQVDEDETDNGEMDVQNETIIFGPSESKVYVDEELPDHGSDEDSDASDDEEFVAMVEMYGT